MTHDTETRYVTPDAHPTWDGRNHTMNDTWHTEEPDELHWALERDPDATIGRTWGDLLNEAKHDRPLTRCAVCEEVRHSDETYAIDPTGRGLAWDARVMLNLCHDCGYLWVSRDAGATPEQIQEAYELLYEEGVAYGTDHDGNLVLWTEDAARTAREVLTAAGIPHEHDLNEVRA